MKRLAFAIATIPILMEGCSGISSPSQVVFPSSNVSYSQHVEPYFTLACNAPGCHNATDAAAGIDLSSWAQIRGTPGLVDVNLSNPQYDTSSTLLLVMFGTHQHTPPINANENQRVGIRTWIMEGAKDN